MESAQTHWTDLLLDWLFWWLDAPLVRQAAGEVARECRAAVSGSVARRTRGMSRPQVRGYVRAMVPAFVAQEVDVVLERRRIDRSLRGQVAAEAIEQLIDAVAEDIVCVQPRRTAVAIRRAA